MRLVPDTVVARAVAILVCALMIVHAVGYWAYHSGIDAFVTSTQDRALAERLVSISRTVGAVADGNDRERTAHALSSGTLDVHWNMASRVILDAPPSDRARDLERRLRDRSPELASLTFKAGYADDGAVAGNEGEVYRHMLAVSVQLPDLSWVNFTTPRFDPARKIDPLAIALELCFAFAIIVIAALLLRWVTRPLRDLTLAAERFSIDKKPEPLNEGGPLEVRKAAKAFNRMRERTQKLVNDRTLALAAVSHDLRTPITRIKLRSETIQDEATREAISNDLDDVETMIASTLEFLRAGETNEPLRRIDIGSMLRTFVDDELEAGRDIRYDGPDHAALQARPVAIKRALWNVIQNALKFGTTVEVALSVDPDNVKIIVTDNGPGVPDDCLARIFEPFFRVEASRSKSTGGTGLGLTIAHGIIEAHGGAITASNRSDRRFAVTITLPVDTGR